MSGQVNTIWFTTIDDPDIRLPQLLDVLKYEFIKEDLENCTAQLQWDGGEGWFVSEPYEGDIKDLASAISRLQGIVMQTSLWSQGLDLPATINIFHPKGDISGPLAMVITFGTIVDRNLFPNYGESPPTPEILRALHRIALVLATALKSNGFALGTSEDTDLRPLELQPLLNEFLDPANPDGHTRDMIFYCGFSTDVVQRETLVSAGTPRELLKQTTTGYVVYDMYANT